MFVVFFARHYHLSHPPPQPSGWYHIIGRECNNNTRDVYDVIKKQSGNGECATGLIRETKYDQ
jgi:hypothetical protein